MEQGRAFLIDSNVLIDILSADKAWGAWSRATLERCMAEGQVGINPIIYAEVSVHFESVEALDEGLSPGEFERHQLPWVAGFAAGQAFRRYRGRGGARRSPLPDFYIGAHAAIAGMTLVTRDAGRYRSYFPALSIIAP